MLRALIFVLVLAGAARAQSPLPGDGARVDLVRGPLMTSSRIMGLGGAFVAVAEGIDGIHRNPAALANRSESATSWLDLDVTVDWLMVSSDHIDWDGDTRGLSDSLEFEAFNLGLVLQLGPVGLGALITSYGWSRPEAFSVHHLDVLLGAGLAIDDGAVIIGAGAAISLLIADATPTIADDASELAGTGGDFGVLWRPRGEPWRLGARLRTPARLTDHGGALVDVGLVPWQVAIGFSRLGPAEPGRRYNPRLRSEVPPPLDRRYLLVSTELVLTGPTDGLTLEGLVDQRPRASGRNVSVALHVGAEGEVFHDRLRARVGSYLEPVRVSGAPVAFRPHVTGGFELRLFELLFDWKATFAFDLAPGWDNVTIGVGFWK